MRNWNDACSHLTRRKPKTGNKVSMKRLRWGGFLVFLLSVLGSSSTAQMFYVTSEPGQQLGSLMQLLL